MVDRNLVACFYPVESKPLRWHVNLILFCMQKHYRLADGVSEKEANLIFNNAAQKVIKVAFKHVCCISVASYYT
jgi:hypothetical protein